MNHTLYQKYSLDNALSFIQANFNLPCFSTTNTIDILKEKTLIYKDIVKLAEIVYQKQKETNNPYLIFLGQKNRGYSPIVFSLEDFLEFSRIDIDCENDPLSIQYEKQKIEKKRKNAFLACLNFFPSDSLTLVYSFDGCCVPEAISFPTLKKKEEKKENLKEEAIEEDLLNWLEIQGVSVERQVPTKKSRFDIWLPNKMIIEVKANAVTENGVCQAIRYYNETQRKVVITGTNINSNAQKTIDAINELLNKDVIIFIPLNCIKQYLFLTLNN